MLETIQRLLEEIRQNQKQSSTREILGIRLGFSSLFLTFGFGLAGLVLAIYAIIGISPNTEETVKSEPIPGISDRPTTPTETPKGNSEVRHSDASPHLFLDSDQPALAEELATLLSRIPIRVSKIRGTASATLRASYRLSETADGYSQIRISARLMDGHDNVLASWKNKPELLPMRDAEPNNVRKAIHFFMLGGSPSLENVIKSQLPRLAGGGDDNQ